ncbi:hypothetical protein DNI29_00140 [Hymenobacter sediminis]|uniref:hypothetical protein n=1 Tax=Hymenobacter sediminis TaxID=2218621 RepID=UPI000F50D54A|nr:hypothetical protein [Hymenobacter sediminis]RPD49249.1 hypothetical protein DNI29_00140 [Hymenobacter sediminis]
MSVSTSSSRRSGEGRRRRRRSLKTDDQDSPQKMRVTAGIFGLIILALLASLGVIAASAAGQ